jgi:hypothetical protein
MTEVLEEYSSLLDKLVNTIDISPTDYQRAVESYNSVGKWLLDGYYEKQYPLCLAEPEIYPQGSFNLGTVVRPLKDGKEKDFDIDLVCESRYELVAPPARVKQNIGDRLKANSIYKEKIDPEGRRCWTLQYEAKGKIPFHMDILPCKPNEVDGNIAITDLNRHTSEYSWKSSNPRGFASWFHTVNAVTSSFSKTQKQRIFECAKDESGKALFKSMDSVPDFLVRTPLQRTIQLLKRHRDIQFADNPENKPISMIITSLAARLYNGETTTIEAFVNITEAIYSYSEYLGEKSGAWILSERMKKQSLITRRWNRNGYWEWYIPNPVNSMENFADKWHENDNAKARSFFSWLGALIRDLREIENSKGIHVIHESLSKSYGADAAQRAIKAYGEDVFQLRKDGKLFFVSGSGAIGTTGTGRIKDHTFYGAKDSED